MADDYSPLDLDTGGVVGDDILSNVALVHFVANPDHIEPFETSELDWVVTGPVGQFILKVSADLVPPIGTLSVSPAVTQHYSLHASAAGSEKLLGLVTVSVDASGCQSVFLGAPYRSLRGSLQTAVNGSSEVRFARIQQPDYTEIEPIVEVQGTGIGVTLVLLADVPWLPDPRVNVEAKFTVIIAPAPVAVAVEAPHTTVVAELLFSDISFDWDGISWLVPWRRWVKKRAERRIRATVPPALEIVFRQWVNGFLASLLPTIDPRPLTIVFHPDANREYASIEVVHCPRTIIVGP